jgi:Ca2+-transporting ATPase
VEAVLGSSAAEACEDGERPLTGLERERWIETAAELSEAGLRVLAVARRLDPPAEDPESDMTFLGLAGMIDPARPEAGPAVGRCQEAGIRVVMVTGDHPLTARAVARDLGILRDGRVISGPELEALSDGALESQIEGIEVCARVSPAHKLRIVTALQARRFVAAMTGDGVNDAPALRRADIGVAMGRSGTDVTREAADMTLLDDNFASIVAAIEEGRAIFSNIRKYLGYLLSCNVGEILLVAGAALAGFPLPLTAVQILYVNLATDGLPALALALDPAEPDLMRRPPRDPRAGLFSRRAVLLMVAGGLWSAIVNLSIFLWALSAGRPLAHAMALTFVSLILIQFFNAYNFRSDRRSVLARPFANRWLNLAILWELMLLVTIVQVPFLQGVFRTQVLSLADWGLVVGAAFTVTPVLEIVKWRQRKHAL